MKENIKRYIRIVKRYIDNQKHKKSALTALKNIENDTNYKLSTGQKEEIKKYAENHFGSKKYAYWLYVYTAYNQEFKKGWIPDNYYGQIVIPKINNHLASLSGVKTLTNKLIPE